ncbi:MAG: TIGR04086 family membrane protein [Clostridiales bacterium]|jgi:putative membrane protein (TIGR04086 family)|nr:TIGR04086 family membrane protein [Clostridiales bacterium]
MRTRHKKRSSSPKRALMLRIGKSALFGCLLTVAIILLFALILKAEWLSENSIPFVTSIIKTICAGLVGFLSANKCTDRAWVWGGVGGASYILLAFISFLILERSFSISFALLSDIVMGFVAGVAGSMVLHIKRTS